ncbi:6,7-dimethyl-8-ribityllumazine synthase [Corynebacterium phocae]|uniref:6,7-dimethyl-8-ribityllumazine synthase n=1 Tax=Corynebacterium phocae TaxID=161895 RepID=A0A1L7D326_9CORY|nr:6,7-dimethyl-8-ribityllumazine synthase [Corynebacterium phocae]APT92477.1 6,7-dimethyl-8-ribityllumazine synthase [Corynebacterium phocae]KAA8725081.1 6,7-dimethyl-8-ribityllumazine synthase [Corynebacterium phocae]
MSKQGLPAVAHVDASGLTVAVVTATWNAEICDQLHARAVETATACGATVDEVRVIGALEIPVVAQLAAQHYDAVVALGCVVRGGTPHFDYVCDSVTQGLTRIALDTATPVGNGILTVNEQEQAYDRAGFADSAEDKGAESMVAALDTVLKMRKLSTLAAQRGL